MMWIDWILLLLVFPGIPIVGITWANKDAKKFVASYPPKYQALAKQASDEMWPRGVLDNIIEMKEKTESMNLNG